MLERDRPLRLFENRVGDRGHWAQLRVLQEGTDAIGALVEIESGGNVQWRNVQCAYSYLSSNDPHVHVGLGESNRIDRVTVHWPSGTSETFGPFAGDRAHVLRAGEGRE